MSILKKDHVLGAGIAAVAAGALGAAIGAVVAGSGGLAVGAVVGGVLGALFGNRTAEKADERDELGHFKQVYDKMPYHQDGMEWDDYAPAYAYGMETFRTHGGRVFGEVAADLESGWPRARGASRLSWPQAQPAIEHAWRELADTLRSKGTA